MNIAIISDSLGFPRPTEGITTSSSYPIRVARTIESQSSELNIFHFGWGGATIKQLLPYVSHNIGYLGEGNLLAVFLQFGVVDSAPRAFLPGEIEAIDKVTGIKGLFKKTVVANYPQISSLRKFPTYTSETEFSQTLEAMLQSIRRQHPKGIFHTGIFPCSGEMESFCPSFNQIQLPRYNAIIKSLLRNTQEEFMDELSSNDWRALMLPDGQHLNELGHEVVAKAIVSRIRSLI
jgi:lysophospholipase L1-like esterase